VMKPMLGLSEINIDKDHKNIMFYL